MKKLILMGSALLMVACQSGPANVKQVSSPTQKSKQTPIRLVWGVEHVLTIKKAEFDFSNQYCRNTVRGGGKFVQPEQKSLIVNQVDGKALQGETSRWMSPGEHVIDYKVADAGGVVEKNGSLTFTLKRGRQYFVQAQLYDFNQVKMEMCKGDFYRLQDDEGLTNYPVCGL